MEKQAQQVMAQSGVRGSLLASRRVSIGACSLVLRRMESRPTISAAVVVPHALKITSVRFQRCHPLVWTTKPLQRMVEAFGLTLGGIRAMLTIRGNSVRSKQMGLGPKA